MQEGKDLKLVLCLGSVEDEVGAEKHEICKLIALGTVPFEGKVKHHPAHSTTRMQHTHTLASLTIDRRGVVGSNFLHYGSIAECSLLSSL